MNLSEILNAVAVKSKRPDREEDILLSVQEATLFCHTFEFFRRDLSEVPIIYSTAGSGTGLYTGQIITADLLPDFRKIGYWRKYDPIANVSGDFLAPVEPDDLFDMYRCKKLDVFYVAGKVLNWYSSTTDQAHIIGYYRFPNISKSKYQSWIAESHPFCIINQALGDIFRTIGQQEESKASFAKAAAQLQLLQVNEIESTGR